MWVDHIIDSHGVSHPVATESDNLSGVEIFFIIVFSIIFCIILLAIFDPLKCLGGRRRRVRESDHSEINHREVRVEETATEMMGSMVPMASDHDLQI
jgi:hypothetical protein